MISGRISPTTHNTNNNLHNIVLCGRRGHGNSKNPANIKFSMVIKQHATQYKQAPTRGDKAVVVASVVSFMLHDCQLKFMYYSDKTNSWSELTKVKIHDKVSHALRDYIKQSEKDKNQRTNQGGSSSGLTTSQKSVSDMKQRPSPSPSPGPTTSSSSTNATTDRQSKNSTRRQSPLPSSATTATSLFTSSVTMDHHQGLFPSNNMRLSELMNERHDVINTGILRDAKDDMLVASSSQRTSSTTLSDTLFDIGSEVDQTIITSKFPILKYDDLHQEQQQQQQDEDDTTSSILSFIPSDFDEDDDDNDDLNFLFDYTPTTITSGGNHIMTFPLSASLGDRSEERIHPSASTASISTARKYHASKNDAILNRMYHHQHHSQPLPIDATTTFQRHDLIQLLDVILDY